MEKIECRMYKAGSPFWYVKGPARLVRPGAEVEALLPNSNFTRRVTVWRVRQIEDGMALGYPQEPTCTAKGGKCSLPWGHKGWCR